MRTAAVLLIAYDPQAQRRALYGCVLASILLHAAVLFLVPGMREGGQASTQVQILTATLAPRAAAPQPTTVPPQVRATAPAGAEAVPAPLGAVPPQVRPAAPVPPQEAKLQTPRPVLSSPTPAPGAPQIPALPGVAPPPAAASGAEPTVPSAPVAAPRGGALQAPAAQGDAASRTLSDSIDAGTLDKYRLDLIAAARRYKRYPAQAMEKGWQGRVEIRLVINAGGMIKTAMVKAGSGYSILDDTALDMIRKAKPLIQIPPSLRGREFVIDVPVIFDLQTG